MGTFEKTAEAGTTSVASLAFDNASGGIVTVTTGTLALGNGTLSGGTFNVSGSAVLNLTGGNAPTFTGTYTGSGAGTVLLGSGTLNVGSGGDVQLPIGPVPVDRGHDHTASNALTNAASGFMALAPTTNANDLVLTGTLSDRFDLADVVGGWILLFKARP